MSSKRRIRSQIASLLCALPVLALLCAASAHAGGVDFTQHGSQPGLSVALDPPLACASCHGSFGQAGNEFMPHDGWSGSMMSHSTRDPLFWAALDVANHDAPGVGDFCLRCHAPQGWFGGRVRKDGSGGVVDGTNGCLLQGDHDDDDGGSSDYSGVPCHLCHRMNPAGAGGEVAPAGSGNVWIDDASECVVDGSNYFGPCRKGARSYVAGDQLRPPHGWTYSAFTAGSAQCGSCHDVSSPIIDGSPVKALILADGTPTGRAFPLERTFTEWKQSRYGDVLTVDSFEPPGATFAANVQAITCQACHMRKSASAAAKTCQQNPSGSRTNQVSIHEFVGGNTWMLGVIKSLYGGAAQLGRELALDRAIGWAQEMLTQRSADIALTLQPWSSGQATMQAQVRITNRAGHKLPTGYGEGRRMWVSVEVRDAAGALLFESGAWNPATGVLAQDPQIKIYEVLQGMWDPGTSTCTTTDGTGRMKFHFVLNDCVAKDNRIPPDGFRLYSAEDPQGLETRPVAYSYPETAPGSGILVNYDLASYSVPIAPGTVGPLQVRAALRYQVASKEYVEFLRNTAAEADPPIASENAMCGRDWSVGPANKSRGQFLLDLWNSPTLGRSPPVDMVVATGATATR